MTRHLLSQSSSLSTRLTLLSLAALAGLATPDARALPQGANVTSGQATLSQPSANQLVITQTTDKAIINWQSFDIGADQSTRFNQPSSSSIALNRITGGSPTEILGELSANGHLMIVNPNGVFFGKGAQVDVAGLIATTADIRNQDFLAGNYAFTTPGSPDASIINEGSITAAQGGLVALVAPSVQNSGVIRATLGTVQLGAAKAFTVDLYGDNLYSFAFTPAESAAIVNSGTLSAKGGKVYLTARAASDVVNQAINMNGIVEARGGHIEGTSIVLDGGNGNVMVAGGLDASGKKHGQKGGTITVLGKNITLASTAVVDASGNAGGGSVSIGGKGTLNQADTVTAQPGSLVNVSSLESSNGGNVVIWSDENTVFNGLINISSTQGKGGNAEVSSLDTLTYGGFTDAQGPQGFGTLLLDPGNWTISTAASDGANNINNVDLDTQLGSANVIINTATATPQIGELGDINVNAPVTWTGSTSLTLTAGHNIALHSAAINATGGSVVLNGGNVTLTNSSITTTGGDITINNTGVFSSNTISALLGAIVALNQNLPGSIQNAINAVNPLSGSTTLTLGDGTWNQTAIINGYSNFTLAGANDGGSGTIIKPNFASSTDLIEKAPPWGTEFYQHILLVEGGSNINVTNLTIDGSLMPVGPLVGDLIYSNASGTASNLTISGGGTFGLLATSASAYGQSPQIVNADNVFVSGGTVSDIVGIGDEMTLNVIDSNLDGSTSRETLVFSNGTQGSAIGNTITVGTTGDMRGIAFHGAHDVTISGGSITGAGTPGSIGISDDAYQYDLLSVPAASNININNVAISDVDVGIAVNIVGGNVIGTGSNWVIDHNTLTGIGTTGIFTFNVVGPLQITNNTLSDPGTTGIAVLGTPGAIISGNAITNFDNGIYVQDSDGVTLASNTISGTGLGTGIELDNSNNAAITGSTLSNNDVGLYLLNSGGTTTVGSTAFSGNNTGVLLDGPSAAMQFSDSSSTFTGVTNYFILQNSAMFGGVLDASQQTFDGTVANQFTLAQWDAAEAKTTDFLDGLAVGTVFYRNFPNAQTLASLQNQLNQNQSDTSGGLYSYAGQTVNNSTTFNFYTFSVQDVRLSLLGGATPNGGTISLADGSPKQPEFARQDGTLFAANTETTGAPAGENLAALAPAAGGDNTAPVNAPASGQVVASLVPLPNAGIGSAAGTSADQLAGLAPAAGGNAPAAPASDSSNSQVVTTLASSAAPVATAPAAPTGGASQLANLAPAAGGTPAAPAAGQADCGNNFLGSGFALSYSAGRCTAQ